MTEPGDRKPGTPVFRENPRPHRLSHSMARMTRAIAEGVAHHVTQRGNDRRVVFDTDADVSSISISSANTPFSTGARGLAIA